MNTLRIVQACKDIFTKPHDPLPIISEESKGYYDSDFFLQYYQEHYRIAAMECTVRRLKARNHKNYVRRRKHI